MKPAYKKPFILTLSSLGIAGVVCAFIVWEIHSDNLTVPQQSLAGVSAFLFILVGIRTVVKWADDWSAGEALTVCRQSFSWKLFFTLVFWDILVLFLAWPLRCVLLEPMTLGQSMERWVCGDGVHYWHIARDWYLSSGSIDRVVQLVFLPGYPLLIRLFHLLIPNWTYAALTVSGLCFALAGTVLYSLLRMEYTTETARRAVKILCILPGSFFFSAPMSESLFLLCCVCCFYFARTNRWILAGIAGAGAAFTRSLGITLMVPMVLELVHAHIRSSQTRPKWFDWLSVLIVPLGFGAYLLVNLQVSGNAFQFLTYQAEHWHQKLGFFFHTASYQTEYAMGTWQSDPHNFWGLWIPNLVASISALCVMVWGAGKLRASENVWFLPYYGIAIGATWLLSAPRYLVAFFPLATVISLACEKRWTRIVMISTISALSVLYYLAFLLRWQVY